MSEKLFASWNRQLGHRVEIEDESGREWIGITWEEAHRSLIREEQRRGQDRNCKGRNKERAHKEKRDTQHAQKIEGGCKNSDSVMTSLTQLPCPRSSTEMPCRSASNRFPLRNRYATRWRDQRYRKEEPEDNDGLWRAPLNSHNSELQAITHTIKLLSYNYTHLSLAQITVLHVRHCRLQIGEVKVWGEQHRLHQVTGTTTSSLGLRKHLL